MEYAVENRFKSKDTEWIRQSIQKIAEEILKEQIKEREKN